jgi:hypothetical protein
MTNVVRLSADNTNNNFGGLLRGGKGNALTEMKSQLNTNTKLLLAAMHI